MRRIMHWPPCLLSMVLLALASAPPPASAQEISFRRIADLNAGPVGSFPSNLTVFAGSLYFSAYTLEVGRELWKYDGNSIVLTTNINETADDIGFGVLEGNDSIPEWLTEFGGALYFSAFDPRRGGELWRYDGIHGVRVADINPDPNDTIKLSPNNSWPRDLTVLGNNLVFAADAGVQIPNYELWQYNGAAATMLTNIHLDFGSDHSSYPTGLTTFNGAVYFMADDGMNGFELWKHSTAGTVLLTNINPGDATSSSFPKLFTPFNDELFFQAYDTANGYELWKTDGFVVSLVTNLSAGDASSFPEFLTEFNGALYFRASGGTEGSELWKYDGETATLVFDINPAGDAFPKNLTVFGNTLYFAADDGVHGWELWRHDGVSTTLVDDLNVSGDAFPEELTVFNDALYFVATTPDTGYELWKYDGESIALAADVNAGAGSSFPRFLQVFNNELCFSAAEDGTSNWELWALNSGNSSPVVTITSPADGTVFTAPASFAIEATASDSDGSIVQVEFFNGASSLGIDDTSPYSANVNDLAAGNYTFTAVATDNAGATATNAVTVTVNPPMQNTPPLVLITNPTNGAVLTAPASFVFEATASDSDGTVSQVEFFNGSSSLGIDAEFPYEWPINNLAAGSYLLSAVATDNEGATATNSVSIPVNAPPSIQLTNPVSGTAFQAPANIVIAAEAQDSDGTIARIEFLEGTNRLGEATSDPYTFTWNNVAAGDYTLSARAIDDLGAITESAPVTISVTNGTTTQVVLQNPRWRDSEFVFSFVSETGRTYEAQATDALGSGVWEVVGTLTGTGATLTVTNRNLTAPHRFYRVETK